MVIIDKIKSLFSVKNHTSSNSWSGSNYSFFGGWGSFLYGDRKSEEKLINEGYISNEDVFSVIKKLVDTASDIPIVLMQKEGEEFVPVIDTSNDYLRLLKKPNKDQTQKEYRKEEYSNYLLTGDAFEWKMVAAGFDVPTSLKIIPSQFTSIEMENENNFFSDVATYTFCYNNQKQVFQAEEVVHTQNLDPTYYCNKGLSFLEPGYSALSTSNQVHNAEAHMIENRGATGMISSDQEGYPLTDEEREQINDKFKKKAGGSHNYNKMLTVGSKVKYTSLGLAPKDLLLTELDLNKLRKFCNIYGISSQLFNDPANKTFNNLGEAKKSLYTESAIPLAQLFVDSWNEHLTPIFNEEDGAEYMIKLDTSKIEVLQSDQKAEAEKNKIITDSISSLASKVSMNQLDSMSAQNILVFSYGMTEEQASELIPSNPIQETNTTTNE